MGRILRSLFPLCAAVFAAAAVACGGGKQEEQPTAQVREPNLPPVISLAVPAAIHEGFTTTLAVSVIDPEGGRVAVRIEVGNTGSTKFALPAADGAFSLDHYFASGGFQLVRVVARDETGKEAIALRVLRVAERRIIVVQGFESESSCERAARVPGWVRSFLASGSTGEFVAVSSLDVMSFSYSGRWCDGGDGTNGATADYGGEDTCSGIEGPDGAALRLRQLIDAAAPSRVTVVGHSMGGLVATYLAGSDPAWARERIASIVAFDSPLQGVPRVNLEVLRLSTVDGGCSWNSRSLEDLSDGGNDVLDVAALATTAVPVYTVDATEKEGPFGGIRQAVPGGRTHLDGEWAAFKVGAGHNGSWWDEASDIEDRRAQRLALGCGIAVLPERQCLETSW